jgi:hypothetical protein
MAQHTAGPWTLDQQGMFVWGEDNQMAICEVRGWGFLTGVGAKSLPPDKAEAVQRANGQLIAAAPDLLEALEMVRDADEDCKKDMDYQSIPPAARAKIDAAILKARGE